MNNKTVAIKLRDAMEAYRRRTGDRMTYKKLAVKTGLSAGALRIMGTKIGYNATLRTIGKLCVALEATPGDLLEVIDKPPQPQRGSKKENYSKKKKA